MGLLKIDENRCKKDGICIKECPSGLIRFKEGVGYPEIPPGDEGVCTTCGHCVSVCPSGALSHERIPTEDCPLFKKELMINEAEAIQFLRSRRSIRCYEDRPVEKGTIRRLIEIARYAPTSGNSQLVEWSVFIDRDHIREIAGLTVAWLRQTLEAESQSNLAPYVPKMVAAWDDGQDRILRDAPVLIVASAPKVNIHGMVDLTLSLSYLDLIAPTLGLGTCWAGILQRALLFSPPVREAVGIPEGHTHHYPMMLGYPAMKYHRLTGRKAPKITWK